MKMIHQGLTFDGVLLFPDHLEILPKDVTLTTYLTSTITLNNSLISATMDTVTEAKVATALKGKPVAIFADGGTRYSGDVCKALAARAHAVMIGSLFAGTEEAPGEIELYEGQPYKIYRGIGSLGAMQQGSSDRYFQEAVGRIKQFGSRRARRSHSYKVPLQTVIHHLLGGVRAGNGVHWKS